MSECDGEASSESKKHKLSSFYFTPIQLQRLKEFPGDAKADGSFIRFLLDALFTRSELASCSFGGGTSNFNGRKHDALDGERLFIIKGNIKRSGNI